MLALLALGSSIAWGASDFGAALLAKRHRAVVVVGWTQGLALVALTLVVAVHGWSGSGLGWAPWAGSAGIAGMLGLVCFYAALSSGTMGVVAPIASLGIIVPVTLGVAFGERPSPWAWIGIVVAIIGVSLASGPELSGRVSARPLVLAMGAAVAFGAGLFCLDRGARVSMLMTLCGMRATSVGLLLLVAVAARHFGGVRAREVPFLGLVGLGDLAANGLFAVASSQGQVSVASVLGSLYPVVTAVLAAVVLRERMLPVQYAGSALAIAGAVVLSLG